MHIRVLKFVLRIIRSNGKLGTYMKQESLCELFFTDNRYGIYQKPADM